MPANTADQQGFHSQAGYHYGQSAEKALKALLIALDSLPPYSHALDRLVESLEAGGVDATAKHPPIVSTLRTARRRGKGLGPEALRTRAT